MRAALTRSLENAPTDEPAIPASPGDRRRIAAIVLNYRTPALAIDCLESLVPELDLSSDAVLVVDNGSADHSTALIRAHLTLRAWPRVNLLEIRHNGGFSSGMSCGIRAVDSEAYLLLNSDTRVMPGAVRLLWDELRSDPAVGLVSPRLEGLDGSPQISCFRFHTPWSELIDASGTGLVRDLLACWDVPIPAAAAPSEPSWTSFAAVMLARSAIERVGYLDEKFFMYFEDVDYCRRVWRTGLRVRHQPRARVVHLKGQSFPLDEWIAARARLPRFYYESRSRYFRKAFGASGPLLANAFWTVGRAISKIRECVERKPPSVPRGQFRDIWTDARPFGSSPSGDPL